MASTRGRQVVLPLTNKSGGSVAAGDVVIIDTSNDSAFTTTTSARSEVSLGVAQETIANNATGRVLVSGEAALINVPASVTRGHYIETHTVAKQATGSSTRRSGSFGQFKTGGATPTAWLWGSTDQTASGTALTGASTVYTNASNYTRTGSTAFADVDSTNLSLTITTGAHKVMIGASFSAAVASSGQFMMIDFTVDSTRQGNTDGLVVVSESGGAGLFPTSVTIITASALSAASHTFRLQFAVGNASHTGTIFATSALTPVSFWVAEMPF